jgi:BASS family bile acid:Na+ symporter
MPITLQSATVLLFLITVMFLAGLEVTAQEVLATMRDGGLVVRCLLANILLMPILAVALTSLFHLPDHIAIGVLLMASAPGVLVLPNIVRAAKGNVAFAVGLMLDLQVTSLVSTPVTLKLLLPAESAIKVPVLHTIATLLLFVLLPLAMGMTVKRLPNTLGHILQKPIRALSIIGFVGMVLLVMLPHLDVLVGEGGGVLSTILILTVAAWVIGWVLGGPDTGIRKVMVLGTSLRNVGLSVLIAAQSFPGTAVGATVTAYFLIQCIANMLLAKYLSRVIVPTEAGASTKPH